MIFLFNTLKKYKVSLLFILFFTYISTACELALPIFLANIINVGLAQNYGLEYVKNMCIYMVIFILITIILNFIISYLITRISILSSRDIRNDIFSKVLSLKTDSKNNFNNSSLLTRTTHDVEQIKSFITTFLNIIFKAPILFVLCIQVLHALEISFYYLLVPAIIILLIYLIITVIKLFPISKATQKSIDNSNRLVKEKITGFTIIKSYNNLEYVDQKYHQECNKYLDNTKKIINLSSFITPILTLLVNSIIIIILVSSINKIEKDALQVGTLIASIQYILQVLLSIIMLSMIIILLPKCKVSINRIEEIMKSSSYNDEENINSININQISYQNVTYIQENKKILNNISFSLKKGEKIGIIGPTGSGKSSLIKLLLKDLNINEGNIKLEDTNIEELTRKEITSNITYIPQKPYLIKGTILDNIKFINNDVTNEELAKIIHCSNLTTLISKHPELLNYQIEESGANLSMGEKQRVCIARALASKNNFIVFDDSFSSLDYKVESEILNNLFMYYKDKALLILSQKISSVKNCDKIIVIDKGKIIACDTHTNLINTCPLYKNMYHAQKEVLEYDI